MIRTYTELMAIPDFLGRFRYLKIGGKVGEETFGYDRWFNQNFYNSYDWKQLRREILLRDGGCDLAHPDRPFADGEKIFIHHMNPIMLKDIREHTDFLLDPEYLIACSFDTHNAIHYGDESLVMLPVFAIRRPNDTCPWR